MADRLDFFFRQLVTEAELDESNDKLEQAERDIVTDLELGAGVVDGMVVTEKGVPDLSVDVSAGSSYDQNGQRVDFSSTQNVDVSVDEVAVSTAVVTPGNEKILSVFLEFERLLTDPRLDGNSVTVFFDRAESFAFNVVQGAEAVIPTAVPPPLRSDQILLSDITLIFGQTTVLNADIDIARREDAFNLGGTPLTINVGTAKDAASALLTGVNNHFTGAANKHPAADVNYTGGAAWVDGTTNPGATVEAQLDKVITDLVAVATPSGAAKLGAEATGAWHDTSLVDPATGSIQNFLNEIVSDLADDTGKGGADKIGSSAQTVGDASVTIGSIYDQVGELLTILDGKGSLAAAETWTGIQTFDRTGVAIDVRGQIQAGAGLLATEANALLARIKSTMVSSAIGERTLVWQWLGGISGDLPIYVWAKNRGGSFEEAFEISINCVWGGTTWTQDDATQDSFLWGLDWDELRWHGQVAGAAAWLDSAWGDDIIRLSLGGVVATSLNTDIRLKDGRMRFLDSTSVDTSDTNPPHTSTPATNAFYGKNTVKCWGFLDINGSGVITTSEGFNYNNPTDPGASADISIGFAANMENANYVVLAADMTLQNENYVGGNEVVGGFDIRRFDADTGSTILHNAGGVHQMCFFVIGQQAS